MNLSPLPRQRFFTNNGAPLAGGKLFTYEAGTTTPLVTYTDSTGSTANTNPIILDANGYCDVWIDEDTFYKFVLKDSLDNTLWTKDNISLPVFEGGMSTGDVKFTIKTVADSGWVLFNDTSIGNASSGATGRANADTEDLFTLLWNNISNTWAPVSSGRGASAAVDFAANKTITLPRSLGRALGVAGAGSGLTSRALGEYLGTETHTLTEAQMPVHTHVFTADSHSHTFEDISNNGQAAGSSAPIRSNQASNGNYPTSGAVITGTNANAGSGSAHPNMQPTMFLNAMIKL